MNAYDVGDQVRLTVNWANSAGTLTDPTTVQCLVKRRYVIGSTTTTYTYPATVTKDGRASTTSTSPPTARASGTTAGSATGTVVAAEEGAFNVPNSEFF